MYAIAGQYPQAAAELEQVAALSPENAQAVADDLAAVRAGRNPFPPERRERESLIFRTYDLERVNRV